MATFLEKNKKKGALAALLLFLRTRKTVTALLLLVALASFLFVSPSNLLLGFPGGARVAAGVAWMAGKMGVDTSKWGLAGGKRDYDDLLAAFRAAKNGGGKAGWSAFMGGKGGADGTGAAGGGSLDFVKGNAKDLDAAGGSGANLPKPGSVEGVLNPDDDKSRGDGDSVALSDADLSGEREGMVKSAFAGGFGSGGMGFTANGFGNGSGSAASGGAGGDGMLSGGAFASSGFFGNGKGATSGSLGDVVKGGVEGIKGQTAKGVQIQGAAKGQLSAAHASVINARTSKGLVGSHTISGQRAFVQLAAGRGRAAISVAPNCTPGSGCPGEFASTNSGAVYDGNTLTGTRTDILTTGGAVPDIGDIENPVMPDTNLADDYVAQAEQMNADAEKCRALDEQYGPTEIAYDKQQEAVSKEFDAMGCGQGGCSKSKAKRCERMGDQMKDLCRAAMTVRCQHIHACPLTAKNACSPSECDGQARNKTKITTTNDGTRTTTKDMGETDYGCPVVREKVPSARQAVQNSIDQYRSNNCEAMRLNQGTLAGKIAYYNKCAGRESQVISTCRNYALILCKSERDCADKECTGNAEECVITELNGIEEFIQKEAKN